MTVIEDIRLLPLQFNAPVSRAQIKTMAEGLKCNIPPEVERLYLNFNGMSWSRRPGLRMLSTEETLTFYATEDVEAPARGVRFFWADDNSNYAGAYVEGPLQGKVCFLDHESPDLSPVYRSLNSFLAAWKPALELALDWFEMPREYPTTHSIADAEMQADWRLAQTLIPSYEKAENNSDKVYWALCVMALIPPNHNDALMPFLQVDDIWIPERACEILGQRKYEPAIPEFVRLARKGRPNSNMASLIALGKIGTFDCMKLLIQLANELGPNFSIYVAKGLERCGCEVGHTNGDWRYRLPGSEIWTPLPQNVA